MLSYYYRYGMCWRYASPNMIDILFASILSNYHYSGGPLTNKPAADNSLVSTSPHIQKTSQPTQSSHCYLFVTIHMNTAHWTYSHARNIHIFPVVSRANDRVWPSDKRTPYTLRMSLSLIRFFRLLSDRIRSVLCLGVDGLPRGWVCLRVCVGVWMLMCAGLSGESAHATQVLSDVCFIE